MTKKAILAAGIAASVAAALVTAYLAPAEAQLGEAAKLIYLHAGLVFVSLILVTCVGILGLLYLVTDKKTLFDWAKPTKAVTLIFWFIYLSSSLVAMQLTWGGIMWGEPRLLLAASIFLVLTAIFLVSLTFHAPRIIASLNVLMGASVWLLLARVPAVMHPTSNPIRNSSSSFIKLDTLLIFLFFLAAAVLSIVLARSLIKD
ncbi:MAG: hypothetical protein WC891_04615 [Actinomycetota bacterium]